MRNLLYMVAAMVAGYFGFMLILVVLHVIVWGH